MAKETITASVQLKVFNGLTDGPIAKKKYLDADDVSNSTWPLSISASGGLLPVGTGTSHAAASLIDAINAISNNQTIETTISMTVTFPLVAGDSDGVGACPGTTNFFIIIDWVAGTVSWTGSGRAPDAGNTQQYNGSALVPGNVGIAPLGKTDSEIMLGTTNQRKISRLPISGMTIPLRTAKIYIALGMWDGTVNVEYTIRTDNNITVVDCPPTDAAAAVGVKISELLDAPSLQDDDLFVLSQDKPDDGIYDVSYKVTLAKLKAALSASSQSGKWVAGDTLSISTTNMTSCGLSIATGKTDTTDTGSIMGQFDVSSKSLKLTQVYNGGAGKAPTPPEEETKTLDNTLQDMNIQPGTDGVIVKAKFDADTLYIELTGTDMRGTYLVSLS